MRINYTRISAFIFLLLFLIYSYLANEIRVFALINGNQILARYFDAHFPHGHFNHGFGINGFNDANLTTEQTGGDSNFVTGLKIC